MMLMGKISHRHNSNYGIFIRIITQSLLLIFLRKCGAYAGENPTTERCETEIHWKPIEYVITIDTDIYKNETSFHGNALIGGVALQDTNEIFLHSKLNITKAYYELPLRNQSLSRIDLQLAQITSENVTLMLNTTLFKDERFFVSVTYNGNMTTNPGIYVSYYKSSNGPRPVVSTELEPKGARFVFPCLDLPRFKAKFKIIVARPPSMVVLTNGELYYTSLPDSRVGNQVQDFFRPSPIMSTYLLSIVICDDYQNVSLPGNSSYWFPRESKDAVKFLASNTSYVILSVLEAFIGITYTHSKLDHVLIPEKSLGFDGMENWGDITWRYSYIKTASKKDSLITEDGWMALTVLAHEIVHQWFGNLVTCRYWCYVWLNEGITEFMGHYIINERFPLTKSNDLFIRELINYIMASDRENPIHIVIEDECCEEEAFVWGDSLYSIYLKGAAIMIMVEGNIMINETFRNGIHRYLKHNMYKTVTNKELWGVFQEMIEETSIGTIPNGTTLETVMDTWTNNGGYPIVHMNRFENGSISLRQEEFVIYEDDFLNVYWWIPLTYTTTSKKDFTTLGVQEWLKPNGDLQYLETRIPENEWIIFNIQQKGYYKVNYDLKTWEIITKHLMDGNFEDIHPMNRASLINDAFIFAQSGFINYSVALNLSKYLVRENDYFPLKTAEESLSFLLNVFRRTQTLLYNKFMKYYKYVFGGIYKNVRSSGFNATDLPSSWLRLLAIRTSCGSMMHHCREQALKAARSVMNSTLQYDQIDPLLRYEMWCYALQLGGNHVYNYVRNLYINEKDNAVKAGLVKSLFCVDHKTIPSLVQESVKNVIYFKGESSSELLRILFRTPSVVCLTVSYLIDHYDNVTSKIDATILKKELDELEIEFLGEECKDKAIELITKFDNSVKLDKNATLLKESYIANIHSWLYDQNLTTEEYSEDRPSSAYKPNNVFLRQDEFNLMEYVHLYKMM